jgi:hypothetical protein
VGDLAALLGLAAASVLATVAVLRRGDHGMPAGARRVGPLR